MGMFSDWDDRSYEQKKNTVRNNLVHYILLPEENNINNDLEIPIQMISLISTDVDFRPDIFYNNLPKNALILKY